MILRKRWSSTASVCLLCLKEMAAESLSYSVCLSNILFAAGFASKAVNKVGTCATNVVFAGVFFPVTVHLSSLLRSGHNWHFALVQSLFCILLLRIL